MRKARAVSFSVLDIFMVAGMQSVGISACLFGLLMNYDHFYFSSAMLALSCGYVLAKCLASHPVIEERVVRPSL